MVRNYSGRLIAIRESPMRLPLFVLLALAGSPGPALCQTPDPATPPSPVAELKLPCGAHGMTPFGDGYLVACDLDLVLVDPDLKQCRVVATEKTPLSGVVVTADRK